MRPWMKLLGGWWIVLALSLSLAASLMFGCASSYPRKYQLGFLSTSQRNSKSGWVIEHDVFGGKHQTIAKEDWEDD